MTDLDKKEEQREKVKIANKKVRDRYIKQGLTSKGKRRIYLGITYRKTKEGHCELCDIILISLYAGKGDGKWCGDCISRYR